MFSVAAPALGYGMVFDWLGLAIALLTLLQVVWNAFARA
jgi:hypothetical protein